MINNRFLYLKTRELFDFHYSKGNIREDSIVLIEDEKRIWTHSKFYNSWEGYDVDELLKLLLATNLKVGRFDSEWVEPDSDPTATIIRSSDTLEIALERLDGKIDYQDQLIKSVMLYADEEDITSDENNKLKFKDREVSRTKHQSYGYKIIRKDLTPAGRNLLLQSQFEDENTIYEIKYDFDLSGLEVEIPNYCALFFNGGTLSNGSIKGNHTIVFGLPRWGLDYISYSELYNPDGTRFPGLHGGSTSSIKESEMIGFTYYDVNRKKLLIWNNALWVDSEGNPAEYIHEGTTELQETYNMANSGFLYKDQSKRPKGTWTVRNNQGGWDELASTDLVTQTLEGLMSAADKTMLDDLAVRVPNLETQLAVLKADFLEDSTYVYNPVFSELLDGWEYESSDDRLMFTYSNNGLYLWVNNSALSTPGGFTYLFYFLDRYVACILNNFLRQESAKFIGVPKLLANPNGTLDPLSCTINFNYYVATPGILTVTFLNEDLSLTEGVTPYKNLSVSIPLEASTDWRLFEQDFFWNGTGKLSIEFTGKIYVNSILIYKNGGGAVDLKYKNVFTRINGNTQRFNNIVSNVLVVDNTLNSAVDPIQIVYIRDLKLFAATYIDEATGDIKYSNNWTTVDIYNSADRQSVCKDKLYLYKDSIYLWSDDANDLIELNLNYTDSRIIDVEEQGFYICDINGNIMFLVDDEGVGMAKISEQTKTILREALGL